MDVKRPVLSGMLPECWIWTLRRMMMSLGMHGCVKSPDLLLIWDDAVSIHPRGDLLS